MSKKISLKALIIIIAFTVIITFQATFLFVSSYFRNKQLENTSSAGQNYWKDKIEYIEALADNYFLYDIDQTAVLDGMSSAYVAALGDKYTYYLTKEEYTDMMTDTQGEMQGIGIRVVYNNEQKALEIVSVMNDSPALASGVKAGDMIIGVGEEAVSDLGYYQSLDKLRGKAGSVADFTVARKGDDGQYTRLDFSIARGYIVEETVEYRMYSDNITGIIRIIEFDKKTPEQFISAVSSLRNSGAQRIVFDVRYNPGGDLDAITSILDYLLPEGPIIRMIDRNGNETKIDSNAESLDMPFAVITNGSTASAAELFTSALRDYNKAIIVGEKTYGKGSMQSIIELPDGSAVSMTTRTYLPPFGESYNGIGIVPDVEVKLPEEAQSMGIDTMPDELDTQLKAALESFNK